MSSVLGSTFKVSEEARIPQKDDMTKTFSDSTNFKLYLVWNKTKFEGEMAGREALFPWASPLSFVLVRRKNMFFGNEDRLLNWLVCQPILHTVFQLSQ